jgi:uncharacterized lipoprotein
MKAVVRVLGVIAMAVVVSACGTFKASCASPGDYVSAEELPPLKAPAGLEVPDTRAALKIPPLAEAERPRAAADECLESPPRFSPKRPEPPAAPTTPPAG